MAVNISRPKKRARTNHPARDAVEKTLPEGDSVDANPTHVPLQVHECSFVKWNVSGVTSLAASPCGKYIAVARTDGNLELKSASMQWTTSSVFYADRHSFNSMVSAMAFSNCSRYLFVALVSGMFRIFRITQDGIVHHSNIQLGGGSIWDLSVKKSEEPNYLRIALASDDGCVRVLSPDSSLANSEDEGILSADPTHYTIKTASKSMGRALSVDWAPDSVGGEDGCIITGDDKGTVRWINATKGSVVGRGKVPKLAKNDIMIWTVKFVQEGHQVICGDSRGKVTVWSSITKTMVAEMAVEGIRGQIWSSALSCDKSGTETVVLGCAGGGVGGVVSSGDQWMPLRAVHLHTHDVRTLATLPNGEVVTGSMDALLRIFPVGSLITKENIPFIRPLSGCVGQSSVQIYRKHQFILSRLRNSVEIWSVFSKRKSPSLRLRVNLESLGCDIRACALSEDSCLLAISTAVSFRIYRIWDGVGDAASSLSFGKVEPLDSLPKHRDQLAGCCDMVFLGQSLVCVSADRKSLLTLKDKELTVLTNESVLGSSGLINRIVCSKGRVVATDSRGQLHQSSDMTTFGAVSEKDIVTGNVQQDQPVSALSVSDDGRVCVWAKGPSTICITNFASGKTFTRKLDLPKDSIIQNVSFCSSGSSVLLSGHSFCGLLDIYPGKRKRDENKLKSSSLHKLPYYDSILATGVFTSSEVALVRRRWKSVLPSLSAAIPKRLFGS